MVTKNNIINELNSVMTEIIQMNVPNKVIIGEIQFDESGNLMMVAT